MLQLTRNKYRLQCKGQLGRAQLVIHQLIWYAVSKCTALALGNDSASKLEK